jgi:hypothetical protein
MKLEKTCNNTIENVLKKTRSLVAPSKNLQLQLRKTHVYHHLDLDLDQTNQQQAEKSYCNKTNLLLGHIGIIAATSRKCSLHRNISKSAYFAMQHPE